jgi:hypothetical protein
VGNKCLAICHIDIGYDLQENGNSNKEIGLLAILYKFKYSWWLFTL